MVDQLDLRTKCAVCGHSFSFHGKRVGGGCKAMGCHGHEGQRCTGFAAPAKSRS